MANPKRPTDANQRAKLVVDIATGESNAAAEPDEKDPAAVQRGKARAEALTPEKRSEIARRAAESRWSDGQETPEAPGTGNE